MDAWARRRCHFHRRLDGPKVEHSSTARRRPQGVQLLQRSPPARQDRVQSPPVSPGFSRHPRSGRQPAPADAFGDAAKPVSSIPLGSTSVLLRAARNGPPDRAIPLRSARRYGWPRPNRRLARRDIAPTPEGGECLCTACHQENTSECATTRTGRSAFEASMGIAVHMYEIDVVLFGKPDEPIGATLQNRHCRFPSIRGCSCSRQEWYCPIP